MDPNAADPGTETSAGSGTERATVSRLIHAPAERIFAVLADPGRHHELDASGMVIGCVSGAPVGAVGDVFRMDQTFGPGREYQTDNHVIAFEPGRRFGWAVAGAGGQRLGWTWTFELEPVDGGTTVTQVYDWSAVDPTKRPERFPLISAADRESTLRRLAELTEG